MKPYKGGIRHDYKNVPLWPTAERKRHWSWFALGLSLPLVTVSLLLISESNESKIPTERETALAPLEEPALTTPPQALTVPPSPAVAGAAHPQAVADAAHPPAASSPSGASAKPAPPALTQALTQPVGTVLELVVQTGDSLERLFRRNDLSLSDLAAMVSIEDAAAHLMLLRPGDTIQISHRGSAVLSLRRELDPIRVLSISRSEAGFDAETIERPFDVRTADAYGRIETSLFEAATAAGISDTLTMDMAGIFQWDIDFILDVRVGDTFTVVYEELWRDGVKLGNGAIVAAEFVNQGRTFRAARYVDATGRADYYTPEGRSVRKAFLRAPVDFTRISSNFDLARRHPILNTIRAHRGVDYAAPRGTPVRAAGDGKVSFRGVKGGFGNAVILKHGGNITTLYGHLSRFADPGVGSRVTQGEIIGYVGASGLATGPHLHYEYRVAGVHRNPRTVKLPPADPIPAQYREDFEAKTTALWQRLDAHPKTQYATASN